MNDKIIISKDLCIGCGACIDVCPRNCFELRDDEQKAEYVHDRCFSCGHCISVCPEGAILDRDFSQKDFQLIKNRVNIQDYNPDNIRALLKSIRSIRNFKTKDVPIEIIDKLLDVTRFAPTGSHSQNVEIAVLSTEKALEGLRQVCAKVIKRFLKIVDNPFIYFLSFFVGKHNLIKQGRRVSKRFERMVEEFSRGEDTLFHHAPLLLVFHGPKWGTTTAANCSIAATYLNILAQFHGLGGCFIGYLVHFAKNDNRIGEYLKIPETNRIYQALVLGYPEYHYKRFVARLPVRSTFIAGPQNLEE
jgi:nitroreductase/NAD-dependent dihydropyrimidine dehydrogenase PreA subunit